MSLFIRTSSLFICYSSKRGEGKNENAKIISHTCTGGGNQRLGFTNDFTKSYNIDFSQFVRTPIATFIYSTKFKILQFFVRQFCNPLLDVATCFSSDLQLKDEIFQLFNLIVRSVWN